MTLLKRQSPQRASWGGGGYAKGTTLSDTKRNESELELRGNYKRVKTRVFMPKWSKGKLGETD